MGLTSMAGVSDASLDEAQRLVREVAADVPPGYVALQEIPYRGHHLLAGAVLAHTEPGDAVFEAGVSSGYFAKVLTTAGRTVDGFELDPEAAERARTICREVHVGDLESYDLSRLAGDYRVLLFGDTLEHLADPSATLRRLRPHLRVDGALIITVPNVANWSMRLGLLAGKWDYTDTGILDRTHLRFYTRKSVAEMVERAGMKVQSITGTVPVPGVSGATGGRITHKIGNALPGLLSYQHLVIATP